MKLQQFAFLVLNMSMLIRASCVHFKDSDISLENLSSEEITSTARQISPEIVSDLEEIADLIPKAAIDAVVAEHYLWDTGFRKALEFLKSAELTKMLDKLQEEPEIVELLEYLQILLPAAAENDLSVPYLEIVLLDAMMRERVQRPRLHKRSVANTADTIENSNLRSFIGTVKELLAFFPHDKFINLINEKCKKSAVFLNFYKALRSTQFRPKVEAALASKNLAPYVKELNSNAVDVHALVPIAFTVISWGPEV